MLADILVMYYLWMLRGVGDGFRRKYALEPLQMDSSSG